jgi:hypothetical protein
LNNNEAEGNNIQQEKVSAAHNKLKAFLIIVLGVAALGLEIYGFNSGNLRYMAVVITLLIIAIGLEGFTKSYNQLVLKDGAATTKNSLKLAAEKAASVGVVSLTLGVAVGLNSFDAVNSEANSKKFLDAQTLMTPMARKLGCTINADDQGDCKIYHEALNQMWAAVWASDVKGMTAGAKKIHQAWRRLSVRWPYEDHENFLAASERIDALVYWSDIAKQQIALLLALLLLPFSVAATSRKLAVAAFDAGLYGKQHVTWRRAFGDVLLMVICWKTVSGWWKRWIVKKEVDEGNI